MKIQLTYNFEDIIGIENLLEAWKEFIKGKCNRPDTQEFSLRLMDNIISLHTTLSNYSYKHGGYQAFSICDPKPRNIHKASVRDRLVHHAVYRMLYPFFDKIFITDSYSCRISRGTHKAISRFRIFAQKISKNNTKTCWILKCDVKKFFASIDHKILMNILGKYIKDKNILWLLEQVISSFSQMKSGKGLPLGNLTSQLFANIYLNVFDQFVKHKLKARYYIRYADDFVILSDDKQWLKSLIVPIKEFLEKHLKISLHPDKVFIKTLASGVDFLGWVHFLDHRVLRTATKKRMFGKVEQRINELKRNKISKESFNQTIQSYLGILKHCNSFKRRKELLNKILYAH